jgi:MYXO-CTERM domain-containing protein
MKKTVATALVALAALAAPVAIGQSQGLALDPVREVAAGAHSVQLKATSFFAPRQAGGSSSLDSDQSAGFDPDPATSWLMALAVLGMIVVRRIRG